MQARESVYYLAYIATLQPDPDRTYIQPSRNLAESRKGQRVNEVDRVVAVTGGLFHPSVIVCVMTSPATSPVQSPNISPSSSGHGLTSDAKGSQNTPDNLNNEAQLCGQEWRTVHTAVYLRREGGLLDQLKNETTTLALRSNTEVTIVVDTARAPPSPPHWLPTSVLEKLEKVLLVASGDHLQLGRVSSPSIEIGLAGYDGHGRGHACSIIQSMMSKAIAPRLPLSANDMYLKHWHGVLRGILFAMVCITKCHRALGIKKKRKPTYKPSANPAQYRAFDFSVFMLENGWTQLRRMRVWKRRLRQKGRFPKSNVDQGCVVARRGAGDARDIHARVVSRSSKWAGCETEDRTAPFVDAVRFVHEDSGEALAEA
ncbi:hypothetical protein GGX14DRAFT_642712 [Mycena pura]|uniref:Uncharacterized protein n=1 Tax=Mycena pura TaxID=153505 RepID=A0AAD6YQC3_9AGAR|nr:hypothetical protein GGX14DRAFT_642712 [Mycena pura]